MKVLFVGPSVEPGAVARSLVERHMLGWGLAALGMNDTNFQVSIHLTEGSSINPDDYLDIEFHFESLRSQNKYVYSKKLLSMVENADIVHVFAPFTPIGEMAVFAAEILNRAVVVTDYGLRNTSLSLRNDLRSTMKHIVYAEELRSIYGLLESASIVESIKLPTASFAQNNLYAVDVNRSGILVARPNLDLIEQTRASYDLRDRQVLLMPDGLSPDHSMHNLRRLFPGSDLKIISPGNNALTRSFMHSIAQVLDLGGDLYNNKFSPDIARLLVGEAVNSGVAEIKSQSATSYVQARQHMEDVGLRLSSFYSKILGR